MVAAVVIAIVRAVLGLCIVAVGIFFIIVSIQGEGAGCINAIIFGVMFLACMIAQEFVSSEVLDSLFGTDFFDIWSALLILMVGSFMFGGSQIAGVLSSLALCVSGLMITGFFVDENAAVLSSAFLNLGIGVMLPIAIPVVLLVVLVGYAFRS